MRRRGGLCRKAAFCCKRRGHIGKCKSVPVHHTDTFTQHGRVTR